MQNQHEIQPLWFSVLLAGLLPFFWVFALILSALMLTGGL